MRRATDSSCTCSLGKAAFYLAFSKTLECKRGYGCCPQLALCATEGRIRSGESLRQTPQRVPHAGRSRMPR